MKSAANHSRSFNSYEPGIVRYIPEFQRDFEEHRYRRRRPPDILQWHHRRPL
jgi:hypothetical protein